ncbi:MAG: hypothetical protein HYR96_10175 [Deltaproteobacteria bacterium]|nr:hypothetical protein [Deltaproteobacteria bacterium]MBI3295389.1 hypothetical protein [Deltaproteobacteria bacterium]
MKVWQVVAILAVNAAVLIAGPDYEKRYDELQEGVSKLIDEREGVPTSLRRYEILTKSIGQLEAQLNRLRVDLDRYEAVKDDPTKKKTAEDKLWDEFDDIETALNSLRVR